MMSDVTAPVPPLQVEDEVEETDAAPPTAPSPPPESKLDKRVQVCE